MPIKNYTSEIEPIQSLAEIQGAGEEEEVLLLRVRGGWYFIADIGLRMLTPRELFDAQGFPHDYVIDFINPHTGRPYPRSDQVARCGNSVCPPVAAALIRANDPGLMSERRAA